MAEPLDPGVATPPVEPAAPAAPSEPTGGDPVTSTGTDTQTVPFSRFQEVNDKAKAAEELAAQREAELEELRKPPPPNDDEPDPDVEKLLDSYAKRKGLVSQEELAAERANIQVNQDISDLTANPPNPGIPYDNKAVMDFAKTNNMPITSKAALRAAYRELNYDKIVEAQRQSAIEGYKKAGSSGAELPGSKGPQAPEEPKLEGKNPKERIRERIRLSRQNQIA